jgi:hypothetical protein
MYFSPLPCYLVPLRPKYPPHHPIHKHPQCQWPSFMPIQNNRQNYSYNVLYIVLTVILLYFNHNLLQHRF